MSANGSTFTLHNVRVWKRTAGLRGDHGRRRGRSRHWDRTLSRAAGGRARLRSGRSLADAGSLRLPQPGLASSTVDERELLRTPLSYSTLETAVNLRKTLDAGVTFVRDAGGADAGVRRAVEDGLVTGPRLQISIILLSQTGGHGDAYSERVGVEPDPSARAPPHHRRRGRRHARHGAAPAARRRRLHQALHQRRRRLSPRYALGHELHRGGDRHRRLRGRPARQAGHEPRHRGRGHRPGRRRRDPLDRARHDADRASGGGHGGGRLLAGADAVHRQRSDGHCPRPAERGGSGGPFVRHQEGARAARLLRRVRAHRSRGGRAHRHRLRLDRPSPAREEPGGARPAARGRHAGRGDPPRRHLGRRRALWRRRALRTRRTGLRVRRHRARPRSVRHGRVPRQGDGPRGVQGRGRLPQRRRPAGRAWRSPAGAAKEQS